jgi:hypothetical protein
LPGERFHFRSDHGEAASGFARARGFDGGIELDVSLPAGKGNAISQEAKNGNRPRDDACANGGG